MKNNFTVYKHLIYGLFLIGLVFVTIGCSCNKGGKNNNSGIQSSNFQPKDEIVIKTEDYLEQGIKDRLEKVNQDSTIPIRIDNSNKNCDMAVFVDKNPCEIDKNETEVYNKSITLEPQSFSDNLGEKFSDLGLKIKVASAGNDQIYQVIKNYLAKSFEGIPPKVTKSTMVGDIMLGRWVNKRMDELGYDYPFSQTKELFIGSDINLANLESPFAQEGPYNQLGMVFRANPKGVESLKSAGINLVNLANNHFGNAGNAGMEYTFNLLAQNNIGYFGAGTNSQESHQPKIMEINGVKFAFLGYADASITPESYASENNYPGLNLDNIEVMKQDVADAKTQADFVIVSMHLGTEYVNSPNQNQIDFAHSAIDAGADFIYGHHPHVVETIEVYNDKPIFYSLGNFVMDQNMGETEQGLVIKVDFMYNKIVGIKLIPTIIVNYAQAQIADSPAKDEILEVIYSNSK